MLLIIDNYDSFTFNLVQLVKDSGYLDFHVKKNDSQDLGNLDCYDKILFSPGPGIPSEAGCMSDIIRRCAGRKSMLGVCLGHQAIAEVFGAHIYNMKEVLHGVSSEVTLTCSDDLFDGVEDHFLAGRYHSWVVSDKDFPECLKVLARSSDGQIMALRHVVYPIYGLQFHPESILTPDGLKIIGNFLKM